RSPKPAVSSRFRQAVLRTNAPESPRGPRKMVRTHLAGQPRPRAGRFRGHLSFSDMAPVRSDDMSEMAMAMAVRTPGASGHEPNGRPVNRQHELALSFSDMAPVRSDDMSEMAMAVQALGGSGQLTNGRLVS